MFEKLVFELSWSCLVREVKNGFVERIEEKWEVDFLWLEYRKIYVYICDSGREDNILGSGKNRLEFDYEDILGMEKKRILNFWRIIDYFNLGK